MGGASAAARAALPQGLLCRTTYGCRMDNINLGFGHGSEGCNNHNFVPNGESSENPQGQNVFFFKMMSGHIAYLQTIGTWGVMRMVKMCNVEQRQKSCCIKEHCKKGGGFTKAEDKVICSAFLNVSKDAIKGVNQSSGGYYQRIHAYFNDHKPEGSNRSQIAIRNHWGLIQKSVNKFCSIKSAVDRREESGKNEQDRIYEKDEAFLFMHCWKLLRNEAKWNDKVLELNTSGAVVKGAVTSQAASVEIHSGQDKSEEPRPEGRDNAKRKRARGLGDAGSSTAVEVLQQLNDRNEKSEVKQEQQMEEILILKGNKMKLGEKMYDLHKHDMEVRTKLKEEQLSLTKKDIEVREKQSEAQLLTSEAQLLTAEVGIMGADLDKLHLK
ncbi:hypothetical protein BS78_10G196900 [Paspalum vaginatum]|nr:hypothetical protein BS78_10G196900 [Paspalum vaginatum]